MKRESLMRQTAEKLNQDGLKSTSPARLLNLWITCSINKCANESTDRKVRGQRATFSSVSRLGQAVNISAHAGLSYYFPAGSDHGWRRTCQRVIRRSGSCCGGLYLFWRHKRGQAGSGKHPAEALHKHTASLGSTTNWFLNVKKWTDVYKRPPDSTQTLLSEEEIIKPGI